MDYGYSNLLYADSDSLSQDEQLIRSTQFHPHPLVAETVPIFPRQLHNLENRSCSICCQSKDVDKLNTFACHPAHVWDPRRSLIKT